MKKKAITLQLIRTFLEQMGELPPMQEDPDATDAQEVEQEDPEPEVLSPEGEIYLVDLLVKAFAHIPSESELKIVDGFQGEFLQSNPKKVAETIQQILATSPESFEQTLDKYR